VPIRSVVDVSYRLGVLPVAPTYAAPYAATLISAKYSPEVTDPGLIWLMLTNTRRMMAIPDRMDAPATQCSPRMMRVGRSKCLSWLRSARLVSELLDVREKEMLEVNVEVESVDESGSKDSEIESENENCPNPDRRKLVINLCRKEVWARVAGGKKGERGRGRGGGSERDGSKVKKKKSKREQREDGAW
jgi:hypothetical protein